MTFDSFETSPENGRPVEAYLFTSPNETWAYTGGEAPLTINSVQYDPATISRSNIRISPGREDNTITVTLPAVTQLAQYYAGQAVPRSERVSLRIRQIHATDGDAILAFAGVVRSVTFENNGKEAKLVVSPLSDAFTRSFPNQTYSSLCPLMLFSSACGLLEGDFEEFVTVSAANGHQITVPGASNVGPADDYWKAGVAELDGEQRLIAAQNQDELTLLVPFSNSPVGQQVRILPGCQHRIEEDCRDKFSNEVNHQGWTYIPKRNPHETGLV